MKKFMKAGLLAALGMSAVAVTAQDAGGRRPGGPGGQRPAIINALDANKDGKLDATEITNATAALKTLDKNGDGEITAEEMFGPRPEGNRRPGGGGPGGPGPGGAGAPDRSNPPSQ